MRNEREKVSMLARLTTWIGPGHFTALQQVLEVEGSRHIVGIAMGQIEVSVHSSSKQVKNLECHLLTSIQR